MTPRSASRLADFCEVCGRYLVSRAVRARGRCGVHAAQTALFPLPVNTIPARRRRPVGGEQR